MSRGVCHPRKKASDEGYTIIWVDESGFYLLPLAVRTWAPRGQTPVLRVKLTHDHLSAISGITLDGRLFLQVRPDSYDRDAVVDFLRVLLRKLHGKILIIWDGSPIHKGQPIKDLLRRGRPNGSIWSGCPATRRTSTRMNASGTTSSGWS